MNSGKKVGKFCLDCTKATVEEKSWLFEELRKRMKCKIAFDQVWTPFYMFDDFQYIMCNRNTDSNYPLITIAELQKMCQEPTIYELW